MAKTAICLWCGEEIQLHFLEWYRLFPPDSIFTPAKDFPQSHRLAAEESMNLASCEIHGLHFKPADPARQKAMYRADALAVLQEYVWA